MHEAVHDSGWFMIRGRTTPSFGFDTVSYQITAGILPWSTLFKAETDVQRIRLIVGTALEVRFPGENCASKVAREDYLTILSRNINRLFRSDNHLAVALPPAGAGVDKVKVRTKLYSWRAT